MAHKKTILCILGLSFSWSTWASSPTVDALGGAGRGGIPTEALFTNPAALAMLTQSGSFLNFTKPRIQQWDAGGRAYSIGAFDGENPVAKGGFATLRSSRARIGVNGAQAYEDRTEYRLGFAGNIMGGLLVGAMPRYVIRRDGGPEQKIFTGDFGAIYPIYKDLFLGFTYENALNKPEELPTTMGLGAAYSLGSGIKVYGDGYRFAKGPRAGDKGWALGGELGFAGDFVLRYGRFLEGWKRLRGWSAGLGWNGPRTSFFYSLRMAGQGPKEKDHSFGITLVF